MALGFTLIAALILCTLEPLQSLIPERAGVVDITLNDPGRGAVIERHVSHLFDILYPWQPGEPPDVSPNTT